MESGIICIHLNIWLRRCEAENKYLNKQCSSVMKNVLDILASICWAEQSSILAGLMLKSLVLEFIKV